MNPAANESKRVHGIPPHNRMPRKRMGVELGLCLTLRTIFLVLGSLMMALVCGGTSLAASPGALYMWVIAGGFSYGGFWGLMPSIASEVPPAAPLLTHHVGGGSNTTVPLFYMKL